MVTFSYVDAGVEIPSHFIAHPGVYQGLFRQLRTFRFLYIATKEAYFQSAEHHFRALTNLPLESDVSKKLLRYFEIRRKWENHEYVVPVTKDLEFLNEARQRFQGAKVEMLYSAWGSGKVDTAN